MIAVSVCGAETDAEAGRLACPRRCSSCSSASATRARCPPRRRPPSTRTAPGARLRRGPAAQPDRRPPETVRARRDGPGRADGRDELMVATSIHDAADRLRSYELVHEALVPAPV